MNIAGEAWRCIRSYNAGIKSTTDDIASAVHCIAVSSRRPEQILLQPAICIRRSLSNISAGSKYQPEAQQANADKLWSHTPAVPSLADIQQSLR